MTDIARYQKWWKEVECKFYNFSVVSFIACNNESVLKYFYKILIQITKFI